MLCYILNPCACTPAPIRRHQITAQLSGYLIIQHCYVAVMF